MDHSVCVDQVLHVDDLLHKLVLYSKLSCCVVLYVTIVKPAKGLSSNIQYLNPKNVHFVEHQPMHSDCFLLSSNYFYCISTLESYFDY